MSGPALTGPAQRLYEWLEPWAGDDPENGNAWAWLAHAIGEQHTDVESVVRTAPSGRPGWVRLFNPADPDDCPDLAVRWVSQFAGVTLNVGQPVAEQRDRLHPDANKRATTGAMVAAIRPLLTGSQSVHVIERDPTAYRHTLITRTSETPRPAAVAAVLADPKIKAVGHWWTHVISDAPLINEWTRTIDSTTATINSLTFADVT